jgi:hypothetical protein
MPICANCGVGLGDSNTTELCAHHHTIHDQKEWAIGNRIVCDCIHRGTGRPAVVDTSAEKAPTPVTYSTSSPRAAVRIRTGENGHGHEEEIIPSTSPARTRRSRTSSTGSRRSWTTRH